MDINTANIKSEICHNSGQGDKTISRTPDATSKFGISDSVVDRYNDRCLKLSYCTLVTRNYIKYADVVYRSLCEHNIGPFTFVCLIIDNDKNRDKEIKHGANFEILALDELKIANIDEMKIYYSHFELCNALKPSLLNHLLFVRNYDKAIYLDGDVLVTGSFDRLLFLLDRHEFILTPHITKPLPLDGKKPNDPSLLQAGIYNGGLYAFKRGDGSKKVLQWLISRNEIYAFQKPKRGMYADQNLLMMAAYLFKNYFYCLDDIGYNIAYWNIHERPFRIMDNKILVDGSANAVFFHFSGFDEKKPEQFSKYQERQAVGLQSELGFITKKYLDYIHSARVDSQASYGWGRIHGVKMTPIKRWYYAQYKKILALPDLIVYSIYYAKKLWKIIMSR